MPVLEREVDEAGNVCQFMPIVNYRHFIQGSLLFPLFILVSGFVSVQFLSVSTLWCFCLGTSRI